MSKIDDAYIKNLQNFSDALENIVELLKEQQKAGTEDTVNELLKSIPENLKMIIDSQKEILKGQKEIKTDTAKILSEMKEIRKKGETGMFGEIGGDNKKKVTDAVKSIILIAGGVLAIGLAFKIVGNVDFASVVGLSLSILIMTEAFKKISEMKIGVTDMVFAGLMLVLISGSLLVSSLLLNRIPEFSLKQGVTILLIAGGLGLATWLILKAVDKVNLKKNWATILLLPVMLPLVSLSILLSSYILQGVQPIDYKLILNIALIGLGLGVATIGIALAIRAMGGVKMKDLLVLPLTIPLVAGGIVLASWILQGVQPIEMRTVIDTALVGLSLGIATIGVALAIRAMGGIKMKDLLVLPLSITLISAAIVIASIIYQDFEPIAQPGKLLLSTFVIGLSVLIFTPALLLIGKILKQDWKALLVGTAGIILLSGAIVAVAWIFQLLPTEMRYPELKWGLNVGLGMLMFLPTLIVVGLVGASGVGLAVLGIGLIGLPLLALSMVAVSYILSLGDWEAGYPSIGWALGVGTALLLFGMATILAAPAGLVSGIFSFFAGDDPLVKLAKSMLEVQKVLEQGKWKEGTYPSPSWAGGVGTSLFMFAGAFALISAIEGISSIFGGKLDFNQFVVTAAMSMLTASQILGTGNWSVGYPSKEWAEGVGNSLFMFAKAFALVSAIEGLGSIISSIFGGGGFDFNSFVMEAAKSMVTASIYLKGGDWTTNYPSEEYAKGVGALLVSMADAYKKINSTGFMDILGSIFGGGSKMDFNDFVESASSAISKASILLASGTYSSLPDDNYIKSFTNFIYEISKLIDDFDVSTDEMDDFNYFLTSVLPNLANLPQLPNIDLFGEGVDKFANVINKLPVDKYKEIKKLTSSISELAGALNEVDSGTFDKLSSMSQGVLLVSIIDEAKLKSVLDTITEKKDELKQIYGEDTNVKEKGFFRSLFGSKEEEKKETNKGAVVGKEERDYDKENYYANVAEIKNLLQILVDGQDTPTQSGSFNK